MEVKEREHRRARKESGGRVKERDRREVKTKRDGRGKVEREV